MKKLMIMLTLMVGVAPIASANSFTDKCKEKKDQFVGWFNSVPGSIQSGIGAAGLYTFYKTLESNALYNSLGSFKHNHQTIKGIMNFGSTVTALGLAGPAFSKLAYKMAGWATDKDQDGLDNLKEELEKEERKLKCLEEALQKLEKGEFAKINNSDCSNYKLCDNKYKGFGFSITKGRQANVFIKLITIQEITKQDSEKELKLNETIETITELDKEDEDSSVWYSTQLEEKIKEQKEKVAEVKNQIGNKTVSWKSLGASFILPIGFMALASIGNGFKPAQETIQ